MRVTGRDSGARRATPGKVAGLFMPQHEPWRYFSRMRCLLDEPSRRPLARTNCFTWNTGGGREANSGRHPQKDTPRSATSLSVLWLGFCEKDPTIMAKGPPPPTAEGFAFGADAIVAATEAKHE